MTGDTLGALARNPYTVAKLFLVDGNGAEVVSPYLLQDGANEFTCMATFIDGRTGPFAAVWTCPIIFNGGGVDFFGVLGDSRKESVTIHASKNHERYTELVCWAQKPTQSGAEGYNPRSSTGFDYSAIDTLS